MGGTIAIGGGITGLVIYLIYAFFGGDPSQLQKGFHGRAQTKDERTAQDSTARFVSVILASTEDVWSSYFRSKGSSYVEPQLVLFTQSTQSGCGFASAATGPFYCPQDQQVYLDLSFFEEMRYRFHAPGDFAMAYVVAHEVGHHIQNLLRILDKVNELKTGMSEEEANRLSVNVELQADFLAGMWAHYAQQMVDTLLEPGDLEEALNAAAAIGDDRLQKQVQGYVVPDAFTHGTSEQRMYWFKRGFSSGQLSKGDTFKDAKP